MSLITQCPACSTMFRVVPDQLRISEGWVRCGQCDEVFDANAHLHNPENPISPPEPVVEASAPEPEPVVEPPSSAYDATLFTPMQSEPPPAYDWGSVLPQPEQPPAIPESPVSLRFDPTEGVHWTPGFGMSPDSLLEQGPPDMPLADEAAGMDGESVTADAGLTEEPAFLVAQEPLVPDEPELPESLEQVVPQREALPEEPLPSFMAAPATAPSPGRWPGKKSLLAAATGLALLLAVQVLMQERDRIAAASPALRPLLVAGCEVLACTVSPLREIESIAIDSSAFTSVRPGVYLLQLTLKNAANSDLATPALELTLTDTQDRPLLRRVLLARELSGKPFMAAGSELAAKLPISVKPDAVPEKIAGYKLLAFYP